MNANAILNLQSYDNIAVQLVKIGRWEAERVRKMLNRYNEGELVLLYFERYPYPPRGKAKSFDIHDCNFQAGGFCIYW